MLQIRIQSTPNPNARKYVLSQDLKEEGKITFKTKEECTHVPLAAAIMGVTGIKQIHFFENVLTVTQNGTMDWSVIDQAVQSYLDAMIDSHNTVFKDSLELKEEVRRSNLSPELRIIDDILDRTIRPALQADGGDVDPIEFDGDILVIRYMGACGGCPSAQFGTLEAIKSVLRDEYRPDIEVVTVD